MTKTVWSTQYNAQIAINPEIPASRWFDAVGQDVFKTLVDFDDEPIASGEIGPRWTVTKYGTSTFAPTPGQGGLALITTDNADQEGVNAQFGSVGLYVPSNTIQALYFSARFKIDEDAQNRWFIGLSDLDTDILGRITAITSSSVANPTVITTATAHGLTTGDKVQIDGHTGSTPAISGVYTVTVTAGTTFTIPVNVSVGGTGGTVTKKSSHMIGFRKDDAQTGVVAVVANNSVETTLASVLTQDEDQYHTLDFRWLGQSNRCLFYVDDFETSTPMTTFGNVPRTGLLLPSIAYMTGEAVAHTMTIDWIRTIEIGRN